MESVRKFDLHLVSDATGETINAVTRACVSQFEVEVTEHTWSMIRTKGQMERTLAGIAKDPGLVLYTIVNEELRTALLDGCRQLQIPCIAVLDPVIGALANYLGMSSRGQPGRQHELDAEYFGRMEAINFALIHDDGQSSRDYELADVVLVGVSRTSKTPTCMYLANRSIKAANFPVVPGIGVPAELQAAKHPLVVGLTKEPGHLVQIRRNRLQLLSQQMETNYVDLEAVRNELQTARRLCMKHGWPMIDVSRRSIEETAATIMQMLSRHRAGLSPGVDEQVS
jgi:[pyruvate, water dikinase]-phosphate phosphotransferase / [pyruvate, water dikinase] kinase